MERYLRLQASVFGDFEDIDLSQESMSKLYQIYLKENMMPSVMKEFDVLSQNIKNRPSFVANDNSINISFASNRIDIVSDISAGENMLKKSEFIEVAIKYLKEFFDLFKINASRMSFISEALVKEIDESIEEKVERKYINIEHVYNSEKIFEWSANSVTLDEWRINDKSEKVNLNVTTALRRLNAFRGNQPIMIKGLVLTQDLNTLAENNSLRLTFDDVSLFLNLASEKSEAIHQTVEGE